MSVPLLSDLLPFWKDLSPSQRQTLWGSALLRTEPAGRTLHYGKNDCDGLFVIIEGQMRAYTLSDEGREITLYRLFSRDICLFSASCMLRSIEFEVIIETEAPTRFYHIPTRVYQELMQSCTPVANFTNELMATRFSDVMWLLDQILFKKLDSRLAAFLLEESSLCSSTQLKITHEGIARHLGSAREVISRMLKYFESEGMVTLSRGGVSIIDPSRLQTLAAGSIR